MSQQQKKTPLLPQTSEETVSNDNGRDKDEERGIFYQTTSSTALSETALNYGAMEDQEGKNIDNSLQECNGGPELKALATASLDSQFYLH